MIYILSIYIIYTMETNNKTNEQTNTSKIVSVNKVIIKQSNCLKCNKELGMDSIEQFFHERFKKCSYCDMDYYNEWVNRIASKTAYTSAGLETRRVLKKYRL